MDTDSFVMIPEYATRLMRLDFYIWLRDTYSEDFIPHIGEVENYSIELPEKVEQKDVYTEKDVALVFDCGKEKALKIMHLMMRYDCSTKIGKNFYTTKEHLLEFMNHTMGQQIAI